MLVSVISDTLNDQTELARYYNINLEQNTIKKIKRQSPIFSLVLLKTDLRALTLEGPTRETPITDPLLYCTSATDYIVFMSGDLTALCLNIHPIII